MSRQAALARVVPPAEPHAMGVGQNPQVSSISRFHDDVWEFSSENRNPARCKSDKNISWSFKTPAGGLFTDAPFLSLLRASKQFIYALRWHPVDEPPFAASALPDMFRRTKRFIEHLTAYPNPILRFRDVLPHHCDEYIERLLGSGLSGSYKYHCLHVLQRLFRYRRVMDDGLMIDPLRGESARKVAGYDDASQLESQTEVIPDEILGQLVRSSLQYVDEFAGYLLDACEAIEGIRKRVPWYRFQARSGRMCGPTIRPLMD